MEDDIYTFRIDAYTPDTMPMARLAEYMAVIANMFGEQGSVHFKGIELGSTKLLSRVEREAAPKVRDNIHNAQSGDGKPEAVKAYKKANEMLREDNAAATLQRSGANVLDFPGRKAIRPPKLGPFNQGIEKDGVLVRIGGKDASAHAMIEDGVGNIWSFEVTRELAIELAPHLFGAPIRLVGTGRFFRDEEGQWQHSVLKATNFLELNNDSLSDVVGRIRKLPQDTWNLGVDPLAMLRSLRNDDSEMH
ncbi:hypothetical protein [Rhodanobacter sp. B04]|uniref:hypothetical protein n=1 Tax=Rhodanobacter sp. B04 TaxID=1945860 RepID=UPI001115AB09|nr:hypothetical protein [Rhodanobacter sp. B04]